MFQFIAQNPILFYSVILVTSVISTGLGIGSFALIPLAALYYGPKAGIGIITLFFVCQNVSKMVFFKGHADLPIAKKIILWSLPGVFAGALLLGELPEKLFEKILAVSILVFIANDIHHFIRKKVRHTSIPFISVLYGFFSGLLGSGNLVKGPMLISLGLTKETYIATSALTAFFMNLPKVGIFLWNGIIDQKILILSLPFLLISIIGTWLGRHMLSKINHNAFYYIMTGVFAITALVLLFN
jgi:hypothetical protein